MCYFWQKLRIYCPAVPAKRTFRTVSMIFAQCKNLGNTLTDYTIFGGSIEYLFPAIPA